MYADEVDVEVKSVISGEHKDVESLTQLRQSGIALLVAFANDDDIQYMRIVSTNIGMIRTYQKRFAKFEKEASDGKVRANEME